jgi:glutamyl-tRNA synthetase
MTVRTRFAPSPTGTLHIGGARTALFAWLAARASGGQCLLRIEDTDSERSTEASVQAIMDGLGWLGLDFDEAVTFQSQRFARYQAVAQQLFEAGVAYYCDCSPERLTELRESAMAAGQKPRYDGHCRDRGLGPDGHVLRFRNPDDGEVSFTDRIRGVITVANAELDDLVILRADGSPTYNFAVVVDDLDMGINLVVRGDDHINNTPRQINLYRALKAEPPAFAHVPMILGEDGKRLSKRHGATSVMAWRELGYVPDALVNYLARLGWSHGDQEVFSRQQLIELFSLEEVHRKPACFDTRKLAWLNQHYLREGDPQQLAVELTWQLAQHGLTLSDGPSAAELLPVQAERCETLVEVVEQSHAFYADFNAYDPAAAERHLKPEALPLLADLHAQLQALPTWTDEALAEAVQAVVDAHGVGFGKLGMPLRIALVGHGQSPAVNLTLRLLGRERALARIERAMAYVAAEPA